MNTLRIPLSLRLSSLLILFCVPLLGLQIVLISRAPWWNLPLPLLKQWMILIAAITIPLGWLASHGKAWALKTLILLALCWCAASLITAILYRNPSLGFFFVGISAYWAFLLAWIQCEVERSYFDPHLSWYQGHPQAIPALTCQLAFNQESPSFRVSRLDLDGAFIFSNQPGLFDKIKPQLKKRKQTFILTFLFHDQMVSSPALPIRSFHRIHDGHFGIGLSFQTGVPDDRKKLSDFIECLKGEGYE